MSDDPDAPTLEGIHDAAVYLADLGHAAERANRRTTIEPDPIDWSDVFADDVKPSGPRYPKCPVCLTAGEDFKLTCSCEVGTKTPETHNAFAATLVRRSALRGLPKPEPLIDGLMSRRSVVLLVGPSNSGKTFVSLSWACSVGTGHDWLGHTVYRTPALYTVGEGAGGLDGRISAWERSWDRKVGDDDVVFSVRPKSLREIDTWIEIGATARDLGAGLIVLDTFSSLAPDVDETKDAATMTRRMQDLAAATDGTVVLVHHPGWGDATRARGGSQLEANADEVLILHGTPSDPNLALERKKVKEGAAGDKIWLRRKPVYESVVIEGVTRSERKEDAADSAVAVIRAVFADPFTTAQLRDALEERLGVSRTIAYEHIKSLREQKRIKRVKGDGRNASYELEDL